MKKVLSIFLAAFMLLGTMPSMSITAYAEDLTTGSCGENATYSFDSSTGTLTISGTGTMTDYNSDSPFQNNSSIKSVIIENGVTSVGNWAFYGCSELTTVTLPDSVMNINAFAFSGCSKLSDIPFENITGTIYNYAFNGCSSLTDIELFCSQLDMNAFQNCTNLKTVKFCKDVSEIRMNAFGGCTELTKLYFFSNSSFEESEYTLPASATIYGLKDSAAQTYAQTYSRTFVEISTGNCGENATYLFDSSTGTLTISGTGAIADYGEGETPFYNNENITSIIINDGITRIGNNAFYCCKGVLNIRFCDSIKSIGSRAFYKCQKIESITLPEGLLSIGSRAFSYCESLKSIDYPSTVTIIEESTFFHCTELEDVVLTSYIESIGDMAFHFCSNLKSIIIPNKDCVIYDSEFTIGNTATIYSYANSTAQSYAEKYNRNFSLICSDGTKEHTYVQSVKSYDDSQIVYEYVCSKCSDSYEETVNHYETGSCGDNANYQYDRLTKTLDITGTGALYNYSTESERPFAAFASEVKTLNIGKKISVEETDWSDAKPYYALAGFTSVENLTISCSACVFEIDLTNAEVDPNDFSMDIDIERMPAIKSVKNLTLTGSEANSTVGRYLFNNYENLETVTLDGEVSAIEIGAFANCPELKSFTVLNDSCSLQKVFEYTIYGDGGVESNKHVYAVASPTVRAHANSLAKDYATEKGLTFVALCTDNTENHNFADGEQYCLNGCGAENPDYSDPYSGSCGENAKWHYDNATKTLYVYGSGAMDDSAQPWSQFIGNIEYVVIEEGIENIGADAFANCVKLQSVSIPNTVTAVGENAFKNCSALRSITIPETVTSIGSGAFDGCTSLISANFTGNSAEWNSIIQETAQEFKNCAVFCSDKQIVNEDKFTIQNDTVYSADKTVLVKIAEGKTLEEYEVPSTVEEVTEGAFEYLNADLIIFDKNVKKLGPKIFGNDPEFLPSEVYEYPEEIETMLNTYYTGGNEEEVLSGGEVIHNSPKRLSGIVTLSNTFAVRPQSGKVITYYCLYSTKKGSCYMSHVANKHQTLAVAQPSAQTFTGSKIQPALKVYNAKTNSLVNNGTAYRVTYGDNLNAGYGHAYIKGIGSFGNPANTSGGYSVEFKINKRTANSNTVWLSQPSYNYNGRVQKPSVKGVSASYFTAYYPTNGNIGVKTVKIVFKGNYTGTVSKTYTILPKKTKLSKLKRGTKSITVKWKKQKKQVDGYQIQYSTNKSFKGAKTVNVKGAKKTSYTVKKLKSKKKYYVRVQTFKKVGGKFYFSGWSRAKSVKVK